MQTKRVDILLVEDNMDDAALTINALQKCAQVDTVLHLRSGEEALAYLFRDNALTQELHWLPKLILLDLKMPRIDGIEILRRIKAHEQTRVIPTLVLTSSREEQDIIRSYQLGANSYLVKPVDYGEFICIISDVIHYWLELNQLPYKF